MENVEHARDRGDVAAVVRWTDGPHVILRSYPSQSNEIQLTQPWTEIFIQTDSTAPRILPSKAS